MAVPAVHVHDACLLRLLRYGREEDQASGARKDSHSGTVDVRCLLHQLCHGSRPDPCLSPRPVPSRQRLVRVVFIRSSILFTYIHPRFLHSIAELFYNNRGYVYGFAGLCISGCMICTCMTICVCLKGNGVDTEIEEQSDNRIHNTDPKGEM